MCAGLAKADQERDARDGLFGELVPRQVLVLAPGQEDDGLLRRIKAAQRRHGALGRGGNAVVDPGDAPFFD